MSDRGLRVGIDLGGTKIEIAALDAAGRFHLRERVPTPRGDYGATLAVIAGLAAGAEARLGIKGPIGVAIPGTLSPATGLVKNANSTWLNGHAFDRDLETVLQVPVRLANDADCFALSEAVDGAGEGQELVFGIIAGTGVGGGLVFNKQMRVGPHAIAGEWGHNPLPAPADDERPGAACYCGRRGCIETWLSGPGLSRLYREASGVPAEPPEIAARAAAGEKAATGVLNSWLDRFARALAGVVNILDPDVVVLGGGLSNLDILLSELPRRIAPHVFSDSVATPIRRARHGDSSGVRGAAWLWDEPR